MTKLVVDQMVRGMKLGNMVTKATPWLVEGMGEREMNVRYIGLRLNNEWQEVLPAGNNLLLKFVIDKKTAYIEYYLANKPPFLRITSTPFSSTDKWETLLGEFRRRLRKDKEDVIRHTETVGNLFARMKSYLK